MDPAVILGLNGARSDWLVPEEVEERTWGTHPAGGSLRLRRLKWPGKAPNCPQNELRKCCKAKKKLVMLGEQHCNSIRDASKATSPLGKSPNHSSAQGRLANHWVNWRRRAAGPTFGAEVLPDGRAAVHHVGPPAHLRLLLPPLQRLDEELGAVRPNQPGLHDETEEKRGKRWFFLYAWVHTRTRYTHKRLA